ncbi:MAG: SurA N-terminal domain-containing protein, partial [Rickettsiaceae bacterium]|nr:SurA N-terminal domain-containing protein [Rickettsiaceae bacterium]
MIRNYIHTWLFKIILTLIMLSFVVLYLPNIMEFFIHTDVVKFKNLKNIGKQELLSNYMKLKAARNDAEEFDNQLLYEQALRNLIQKRLSENLIDIYGLKLNRQDLQKLIAERNNLKDANGQIDLKKFQEIARFNRISELELLNELKYWLLREQVVNSFILNIPTPNILKKHLDLFSTEVRKIEVVAIDKFDKTL